MIDKGTYVAVAREWQLGETNKGGEQVAIAFEVVEGEFAGQVLTWFGFFTDKTEAKTVEGLRNAGWRGDDITTMEGLGEVRCSIVVEHEVQTEGKNAGKIFPRVRWVNRLGAGRVRLDKPLDARRKREFAARMKMLAKGVPAVDVRDDNKTGKGAREFTPETSRQTSFDDQREGPPPHGDDDIPF